MNHKIVNLSLIFITLFASTNMHAYRWIFSNFTDKTLIIQVELKGSKKPYFAIVYPDRTADFEWKAGNPMFGFCLGKIKWAVLNTNFAKSPFLRRGFELEAFNGPLPDGTYEIGHNYHTLELFEEMERKQNPAFKRKEGIIRAETDPLFQQTVKSAGKLGGKLATWIANKMVAESKCRGRDYAIVEENGKMIFYTQLN